MEIIEISSEASQSSPLRQNSQKASEVILISEDRVSEGTTCVGKQEDDDRSQSNTRKIDSSTNSSPVVNKASMPRRNLLDLKNWISSSEDDVSFDDVIQQKTGSFSRSRLTPSMTDSKKGDSLIKKVLCSSPISERSNSPFVQLSVSECQPEFNDIASSFRKELSASLDDYGQSTSVKRRLSLQTDESNPIVSSSSSFKKPVSVKKSQKRNSSTNISKEWQSANKVSRKKNDILSEMVIEIAMCLKDKLITEYFSNIFQHPIVRTTYLELPLISWKRRVVAKYDKERDIFVPCELTEISERILCLYYEPADFVLSIKDGTVEEHISQAKYRSKIEDSSLDYFLFIMIPGLRDYIRRLKSVEDRRYRNQMLSQLGDSSQKDHAEESNHLTAADVTKLIIETEIRLGVNIFVTKSIDESIDWLHSFTSAIGSSLYDKFERNPQLASIGNIRSGTDARTTFLEMVKKFNLMTSQKAEKLYQFYDSPISIYTRYLSHDNLGTVNGKNIIPPSVNAAMRRVFTSSDPNMVITD